jgi:DivIVA domain-containing protein
MSITEAISLEAPTHAADLPTPANFRIVLRGFDREEVQDALERIAAEYHALSMKNVALQKQIAGLESRIAGYQREEQSFRSVVLMLQKQYDEARQRAADEVHAAVQEARDRALHEARAEAEELLARAHERVRKVERYVRQLQEHQTRFYAIVDRAVAELRTLAPGGRSGAGAQPQRAPFTAAPAAADRAPAIAAPERSADRPPAVIAAAAAANPKPAARTAAAGAPKTRTPALEIVSPARAASAPSGPPPAKPRLATVDRAPEPTGRARPVARVGRMSAALAASRAEEAALDPARDAAATVEQIEAMLKGIDGALLDIPALPAE